MVHDNTLSMEAKVWPTYEGLGEPQGKRVVKPLRQRNICMHWFLKQ